MQETNPLTARQDDLGVDWERFADGRARRLKRKRDFPDVDPARVRADANAAAKRMGKAVLTVRDKMIPHKYLWVQFADHKIGPGEPCPCGSRRLLRLHANFLRCPQCRALILLSNEIEIEEEAKESRATRTLRGLTDVHLQRRGQSGDLEVYRGHALQDGVPVFLLVDFRLKPREDRLSAKDLFDRAVFVRVVPLPELNDLFGTQATDIAALWAGGEPDWDFVW
jgi:hypothetical protein